jgi:integrase
MSVVKRKRRTEPRWTIIQRKLLAVLEQQEHRALGPGAICKLAGYSGDWAWDRAIKDPRFVTRLKQLGVSTGTGKPTSGAPQKYKGNLEICLVADPEEELAKDIWDMRKLFSDYPRHRPASDFIVNFTALVDSDMRAQVKLYFRHQLTHWKAGTFKCILNALRHPLGWLPRGVHLGTITRSHIEEMLPLLARDSQDARYRGLRLLREMLEYAAASPAWPGPRPPRDLIWREDMPVPPVAPPRPLPPDVLDRLDGLLQQAVTAMEAGHKPAILSPMDWDAVLILRRTGMRCEDLAHLRMPDAHGHDGCLVQDSEGYWWIAIDHRFTKAGRDHRIPTRQSDGTIAAIRRQQQRAQAFPDYFQENYLFRHAKGVLEGKAFTQMLQQKLAPHLLHEGKPYRLTAHQFRHTLASEMIDQGVDVYTVKEFLGHKSLAMTERYIQVYLKTLKTKYDAYRAKQQPAPASLAMNAQIEATPPGEGPDGGWVENKVGTLYRSPLPDGIGWCEHLAMLDPCPTPPHCPTCPKLRASKQHLPTWESKAKNLLITVEALRDNPIYERAKQRHELELQHTEKVVATIRREGFWDGRLHNS